MRPPTSHEWQAGQPWDASYLDGPAPWDIGEPQPAVMRLAAEGAFAGAVLDCALFHTFDSSERRDYVASLAAVTSRGANVYVLCFSDVGPGSVGPHPVSQKALRAPFGDGGWSIAFVGPERLRTRFDPRGAPAWMAKVERV